MEAYNRRDKSGEELDDKSRKEGVNSIRMKMGVIGKIHNIVVHIRASPNYTNEFEAIAGKSIPLDNCTRWNSQYKMLVVLLNLSPIVKQYYADYKEELKEDILNHPDQKKLRTIKEFLGPFTRATLAIEGDSASINSILFNIDVLIKHL